MCPLEEAILCALSRKQYQTHYVFVFAHHLPLVPLTAEVGDMGVGEHLRQRVEHGSAKKRVVVA